MKEKDRMDRENELMNRQDDAMEIDLLELFRAWKRRIWLILLVTFLGGSIGFAFSKLALTPQFTSTAMMYVLSKETTLTSLADLQIGSQLTQDYKVITTSRPVLEGVIEELGLDLTYEQLKQKISIGNPQDTRILSVTVTDPDPQMAKKIVDSVANVSSEYITYEQLKQKISIGNPQDTRILSVTVTDPDPQMAKKIVDSVANVSSEYIGDIMEMIPPKMIEDGQLPTQKSSPSNAKNAMLGAMLGMILTCGLITLQIILNDTIQTEEDVEKYLGLTVLAEIPVRDGEEVSGKSEKAKKKRQKEARKQVEREMQMSERTNGRSRKKGNSK